MSGFDSVDGVVDSQQWISVVLLDVVPGKRSFRVQRIMLGKVTNERPRHDRHVPGGRVVIRMRQTGCIDEIRIRHTELRRVLIHQMGERRLVTGDELGERHTGVVSRLNDDTLEKIFEGHLVSDFDEHLRATHPPGLLADQHGRIELKFSLRELCEHHVHGHHLGQARRLHAFVLRRCRSPAECKPLHRLTAALAPLRPPVRLTHRAAPPD